MKKLLLVGIILTMLNGAIPVSAGSPVTITYDDITLPTTLGNYWLPTVWNLNACDVTVFYTLDLSGAPNVIFDWNWNNAGNVGLFSNEGSLAGARMSGFLADWNSPIVQFPTYPDNDTSLDNDDKFNLQRFPNPGNWDESMYDVDCFNNTVGAPTFNPWANYGIWFDRDGVDQYQDDMWGMVNGGTYNTQGVYDVEILFRKSSDNPTSKGTACATFFPDKSNSGSPTGYGIPTGFYSSSWYNGPPGFYPAGISFETAPDKMSRMMVNVIGSSGLGTIIVKNIEVTGCLANIVIDGCDTGVTDQLFSDNSSVYERIEQCETAAENHGQFVSCVATVTNDAKKAEIISGQQKGAIQSCVAQANIP